MKTKPFFFSLIILLLALSACNFGTTSPSELVTQTATSQGDSVQLPNVSAGSETGSAPAETQPGESVFLPSLGAGEDSASGPGGGGAEEGGGIAPGVESTAVESTTPEGAFIPNVGTGDPSSSGEVDAYVDLQASALTVQVGETITLTAKPVQIGLPFYYLIVRDEGVQDAPPMVQVTYENVATLQEGSSQVITFVSAQANMDGAVFVVRAVAPGVTTVGVTATGELTTSTGTTWSGAGSGELIVSVIP